MSLFVWLSSTVALVLLLSLNAKHCLAQECSGPTDQTRIMNAPAADSSAQVLSGDLQLLIPAWRLNDMGFVYLWQAIVQGNANNSAIEFQIFEPNSQKNGVYDLIYGNRYDTIKGGSQSENNISVVVDRSLTPPLIPVRPGYIIGVRLRNNTPGADPSFGLQYISSSTEGVDVYYWQGMGNQTCSLSTCDSSAGVLRGVIPLLSWRFCLSGILAIDTIIFKQYTDTNPLICSQVSRSACPLPSTTITQASTPLEMLSSSSVPPVMTPSVVRSVSLLSVTNTPTDSPPESFLRSPINLAAMSVAILLFLMVIVLIIIIICITMRKRTHVIKIGATPGIDNPDYHQGDISHVEGSKDTLLKLTQVGETVPNGSVSHTNVAEARLTSPPAPQIDSTQYFSTKGTQDSMEDHAVTKLDTQTPQALTSSVHFYSSLAEDRQESQMRHSKAPSPPKDLEQPDYDLPNSPYQRDPSTIEKSIPPSHYYSTPETSGDIPPPPHYYSSPPCDRPTHQADDYDEAIPFVPNSSDHIVTHSYDEIRVPTNKAQENPIYIYVPTSEQRDVSGWRYEMSDLEMQQGYDKLRYFEETNTFWAPAATTTGLYEQLAARKYREIPRQQINIIKPIGEGNFGTVSKGAWILADSRHEVAVKMLKIGATDEHRVKLLQEAAIMGQFVHKNVVKLHGVVTIGEPAMMVLELMARGDLRSYLRSIQKNHRDWKNPPQHLPNLLLRFCRDIASGMCYLSHKSFIHRDLAARNILLTTNLTCKIGDFGMARDLMADEGNYYTSSGGIIPLKWTAPEALNYKKYTTASDVWSYGMVLFEIWSLGCKPFKDLSNPIVLALINSKHCQPPPPGCPRAIYKMMVECWNPEHALRPSFDSICNYLDSSDEILLHWSPVDYSKGKFVHLLGAPLEEAGELYSELQRLYQQQMLENSSQQHHRRRPSDRM